MSHRLLVWHIVSKWWEERTQTSFICNNETISHYALCLLSPLKHKKWKHVIRLIETRTEDDNNSTQRVVTDAGVNTSVRISMTLLYIYAPVIMFTDLSPVPVRSAKPYFTSWSIQHLSKRNRLTELTSTTWLGKLFQILTIRAEK